MQTGFVSVGRLATPNASKYLQQLCKHFAHKIDVRYDEHQAEAALHSGPCRMWADADELRIEVTAPDAVGLERAQGVVDSHLARFAFREEFTRMDWAQPTD